MDEEVENAMSCGGSARARKPTDRDAGHHRHEQVEQQDADETPGDVDRDVQPHGPGDAGPCVRGERQHQPDHTDRRECDDPTYQHQHGVAQSTEERQQRGPGLRPDPRDGKRQQDREDHQLQHIAVRSCRNGIGGNE